MRQNISITFGQLRNEPEPITPIEVWINCPYCDGCGGTWIYEEDIFEICSECDGDEGWWQIIETKTDNNEEKT
jgi:hypothetical protein